VPGTTVFGAGPTAFTLLSTVFALGSAAFGTEGMAFAAGPTVFALGAAVFVFGVAVAALGATVLAVGPTVLALGATGLALGEGLALGLACEFARCAKHTPVSKPSKVPPSSSFLVTSHLRRDGKICFVKVFVTRALPGSKATSL
jgi:hypothetical protein